MRNPRNNALASAICAGLFAFSVPAVVYADDHGGDSSADSGAKFVDLMNSAHGVIVAVPTNAAGEENTDAAVLRAYTGPMSVIEARDFNTALANSVDIGTRPEVLNPTGDSNTDGDDSSTWGNWWGHGYRNYGYYNSYRPYYSYYNNYNNYNYGWNYGSPYYSSYYGNYGYYYGGYGYSNYNCYYYPSYYY